MRPGRSAWTLAVVALGVGALFLVGWRIGTGGDALSAPSTPIDSPYFAVDVASSGPRARVRREKEDEKKKEEEEKEEEEEEGERGEIEREDRSAPSRDYSPAGRETRGAPRSKRRSEERSKGSSNNPPPNLENGSTIDFGRKKDEEESGSRATDKLLSFPWTRNLEERGEDDDESEDGSRSRGIGWGGNAGDKVAASSSLSSDLARKEGNRAGDSRKISFPWNPEREEDENSDGSRRYSLERVVGRSRESFEDDRESTSYWVSGSPSLRVDRDSLASLDPEEEKDGIKDDRSSWTSYPAEKSLPLSNVETKERRIEDVSLNLEDPSINFEKNHEEKWIDRRSKEGNFLGTEMDGKEEERASGRTARRNESYRGDENAWRRENNRETSEDPITKGIDLLPSSQRSGKRGRGEEDGTRFSTDDDEQRTRTGTLNGPSERSSDVEENLSREVNGRSMNEVEKSSGQSYLGSGRSLTSDARVNRGETESRKAEIESESGHHPSNQPRSSSTERGGWRRVPWNTNKKEEEHVDERSISIEEVGTRWNEIVADFHNSERAEQGYGRGGESISPDSYPPATPMPRDLFFRRDHGSSANTFVSGRGEGNRDRGNILEGRSPIVHSPTIDIRRIDEKLENNDDNDDDDDDGDDSRLEGLRRESFDEEFPSAVEERHGKEEDLGRESSENLVGGEEKTGDEWAKEMVEKFERRAGRIRRRRYANYYSQQSATPMAYVHIQPVYPVAQAPPPNRKCVQCMVVYKPCPSTPRQPPFPTYKYQELASKWFGLKYGK